MLGMRYVGYVAASTLEDIKQQWGDLWEGEVNYILFDRECLRGFDRGNNEDHPENKRNIRLHRGDEGWTAN